MSKIINVRGTNGSGKSTLVKTLLDRYSAEPIYYFIGEVKWYKKNPMDKTKKDPVVCKKQEDIKGYVIRERKSNLPNNLYILGSYKTPTGGCDTVGSQAAIHQMVRDFSKQGDVLYEGLLVSGLFEKYNLLADELREHHSVFGFLDTPIDLCIQRTLGRRAAAGNDKPFDPAKTQIPKFEAIKASRRKFEAASTDHCECCKSAPCVHLKKDVRTVPHTAAVETVLLWLLEK